MIASSRFRDRARGLWQAQRIKAWVRRHLGLGAHSLVMIAEVPCPDPRCPGPATAISVLGLDLTALRWTLHKPAAEVREADIAALMGDTGPRRQ